MNYIFGTLLLSSDRCFKFWLWVHQPVLKRLQNVIYCMYHDGLHAVSIALNKHWRLLIYLQWNTYKYQPTKAHLAWTWSCCHHTVAISWCKVVEKPDQRSFECFECPYQAFSHMRTLFYFPSTCCKPFTMLHSKPITTRFTHAHLRCFLKYILFLIGCLCAWIIYIFWVLKESKDFRNQH